MATNPIYVGDTGTAISLDCVVDISDATVVAIEVRKPNDTVVEWPATRTGNVIRYDTRSDSLDIPGQYKLQAKITTPGGVWSGKSVVMNVKALWSL